LIVQKRVQSTESLNQVNSNLWGIAKRLRHWFLISISKGSNPFTPSMHNDDKSLIQTEAKLWELIEKSKKVLLAKKSMFFRIELGPSNYGLLFTLKRAGFIYRYVKGRGNTYTV
jgi:hypothetical protein